eukprot:TRINITY_DN19290_c0_g1_i1.p1 TRINITY_DN19290_c0_g1~~TRINITY_DN19290_c0_g1_i1.p1  ORF type:complete len:526 (+),score=72.95 TRINITY_DN19290_c0_g1_i1:87-1664(+)
MKKAALLATILWGLCEAAAPTDTPSNFTFTPSNVTHLETPEPQEDIPLEGRIIALVIGVIVCALGIAAIAWQYRKKPHVNRDEVFRASVMQYINEKDLMMLKNPPDEPSEPAKSVLKDGFHQKNDEDPAVYESLLVPASKRRNSKQSAAATSAADDELKSPVLSTPSDDNQKHRLLSISETRSSPNNPLFQSGSERFDVISDGYRQSPVSHLPSPHQPGHDLYYTNSSKSRREVPDWTGPPPNSRKKKKDKREKKDKKDKKDKRDKRSSRSFEMTPNQIIAEEFRSEWASAKVEETGIGRRIITNRHSLDSLNSPSSRRSGCWSSECAFCGRAATMMCTDCGMLCTTCNSSNHSHTLNHLVVPLEGGNDANTSNGSSRGRHSRYPPSPSHHIVGQSRIGNYSFDQSLGGKQNTRRSVDRISSPSVPEDRRKQRKEAGRSMTTCSNCNDFPSHQCSTCELLLCGSPSCRFSPCVIDGFPHNLITLCTSCRSRVATPGSPTCSSCSQKLPSMGRGSSKVRVYSQMSY